MSRCIPTTQKPDAELLRVFSELPKANTYGLTHEAQRLFQWVVEINPAMSEMALDAFNAEREAGARGD